VSTDPSEWAAPLPRARADRLRAVAPALLLAAVALLGVRNHVVNDQSSWEGASFGMFATYDNHVSRIVEVTVTGPDGPYRAALPDTLQDDALRLRVAPSRDAAERLAREVLGRVVDDGATEVTVELWRIAVDGEDGFRLRLEPVVTGTAAP
jgi:hypothetical protein